ncbi:MAG: hypothetical protein IH840_00485 [Candidatus Heimdallarchaeota archaeon]|nr:hypothetical protein [Candidatus Heimdallarchaeota archaeon]
MIFSVVLTIIALLFLQAFVVEAQLTITRIEERGDDYIRDDQVILDDLNEFKSILDQIRSEQVGTIITELLFEDNLDVNTGIVTLQRYGNITGKIQSGLTTREENGYRIAPVLDDSNQFIDLVSTFDDDIQTYVDDNDDKIETLDMTETGALSIFNSLDDQIAEALENEQTFTVLYSDVNRSNPTGVITAVVNGVPRPIFNSAIPNDTMLIFDGDNASWSETEPETIEEIITLMNTQRLTSNNDAEDSMFPTTLNQTGVLPRIAFLMDRIIARSIDPESVDAPNSDLITIQFLSLYRAISNLFIQMERIQSERSLIEDINIEAAKVEFSEALILISGLQTTADEIRGSISLADPGNVQDLVALYIIFTSTRSRINSVLEKIFLDIPLFVSIQKTAADLIEMKIQTEQSNFENLFDDLTEKLQDSQVRQIQQISILLIIILSSLSIILAYQLITSFRKFNKNYDKIGEGNLQIKFGKKFASHELGTMESGFKRMIDDLRSILTTLQKSAERIAGISEELAAGAEEASASVQEVSNTVREFSAGAAEQNILLNRINDKLTDHLTEIENASRSIDETSNFVLKVAKRTNILGLNASIEAAKAGNFGRGFNVVAEEVRNLSNDTKSSAIEIASLIETIETNIQQTVRDILREVNITREVAENTAAGSEEANAATSEQVIMLSEISQTSNELSLLASDLQEIIQRFQL